MHSLVKTRTCRVLAGTSVLLGLLFLPVSLPGMHSSLGPESPLVYERLQSVQPAALAAKEERSAGDRAVKPLFWFTNDRGVEIRCVRWRLPLRHQSELLVCLQSGICPRSPPSS